MRYDPGSRPVVGPETPHRGHRPPARAAHGPTHGGREIGGPGARAPTPIRAATRAPAPARSRPTRAPGSAGPGDRQDEPGDAASAVTMTTRRPRQAPKARSPARTGSRGGRGQDRDRESAARSALAAAGRRVDLGASAGAWAETPTRGTRHPSACLATGIAQARQSGRPQPSQRATLGLGGARAGALRPRAFGRPRRPSRLPRPAPSQRTARRLVRQAGPVLTPRGAPPSVPRVGRAGRGAGLGGGTNLQALLDDPVVGPWIALVLSDRPTRSALERARSAGVEAVVLDPASLADRAAYDRRAPRALRARRDRLRRARRVHADPRAASSSTPSTDGS